MALAAQVEPNGLAAIEAPPTRPLDRVDTAAVAASAKVNEREVDEAQVGGDDPDETRRGALWRGWRW